MTESPQGRCLRHAGPVAARAVRDRLLREVSTGRITAKAFGRAMDRRARNALAHGWKRDPSLPGRTIDLGAHEARFAHAVADFGLDVSQLLPAVRDWLAWRFQRLQVDLVDPVAWARVVREDLPAKVAAAEAAMVWVRAGILDRRTKAARRFKAELRRGGPAPACDLAALAGAAPVVRPWVWAAGGPSKRALPDRVKGAAKVKPPALRGPGRPRKAVFGDGDLGQFADLLREAGPEVRVIYDGCATDAERAQMLRVLQALRQAPGDSAALQRWLDWVRPRL